MRQPYETIAETLGRLAARARPPLSAGEIERRLARLPLLARWDVFVSHSSKQETEARQLRQDLVDEDGLHTFVAAVDLASRVGSDRWRKAIDKAFASSEALVVLVTADAMSSDEVNYEIRTFEKLKENRGYGQVVPVRLGPSTNNELESRLRAEYQAVFCPDGAILSTQRQMINVLVRGAAQRE